jgi:hypothetical protein
LDQLDNMNKLLISIKFWILIFAVSCKPAEKITNAGVVVFKKGDVYVETNGKKADLQIGMKIYEKDTIITANKGVAILSIYDGRLKVEVQPNARLTLDVVFSKEKKLSLAKGNAWLDVSPLPGGETISLHTPATVAAVRGTRFFTFRMGEMWGTCHCEGAIDFSNKSGSYEGIHHKHYATFTDKQGRTIVITEEDGKQANLTAFEVHKHSLLDDSAVGPKAVSMSEAEQKIMGRLIANKFAELD